MTAKLPGSSPIQGTVEFQGRSMKRRSKIVCTLGPAVDSREKIKALIEAGMNMARINCSHGEWETRRQWIEWIRDLSSDIAPIAISSASLREHKSPISICSPRTAGCPSPNRLVATREVHFPEGPKSLPRRRRLHTR